MNVYQILKKKFKIKLKHHNNKGAYRDFLLPRPKTWFYYHELAHLLQLKNYEQWKKSKGFLEFKGRSNYPLHVKDRLSKKDYLINKREIETYVFQYKMAKYAGLENTLVIGQNSTLVAVLFSEKPDSLLGKIRLRYERKITKRLIKKRVKRENTFQRNHLKVKGFI